MIEEDKKEIPLTSTQIRQLTLDCFLHHKLKLRRNWGQTDETEQLSYSTTTLLQFITKSCNFQILIKPKEKRVILIHSTKRGRKLFIYFNSKILQLRNTFEPF